MKALVKVLYEDQQAEGVSEFGLHLLVRRCVLDQLGWSDDRWTDLKDWLYGHATKGDTKLLSACENAREARGFPHVFAVFDDDKIRRRLGLTHEACTTMVRGTIQARSPFKDQLQVVLLGRNMESVVAAVERCKGRPESGKLKPPLRDSVLASIAWRPDHVALRECVLAGVPSLRYLVGKLAAIVRAHATAQTGAAT
jgi:hypothetical protein